MHRNLIVDINNIIFTMRHAKIRAPKGNQRKDPYAKELIFKDSLAQIVHFANEFQCDAIVIARDAPNCWRKDLFAEYKDRDHSEDVYFQDTIDAADMITHFFATCTNATIIEAPRAEADDVIAVFCQESRGVENIILSSDKDFIQLVDDRTQLYSPPQKKFRTSDDPEYDLFVKAIRGDVNDNIRSAFPRVRETRLKKAWEDQVEMLNLLETVRKDGEKVADSLDFNMSLMDLSAQPAQVRHDILQAINAAHPGNRFGEFRIMRFFGDNNLKEHADMLAYKEKPLRGKHVFVDDK